MGGSWARGVGCRYAKKCIRHRRGVAVDCPVYLMRIVAGLVMVCGIQSSVRAEQAVPASPPGGIVGTAWELAVQRAGQHIEYGLNLGSRQAVYSAQSEFLQALRLIARELDLAAGTREHEAALEAGWRALETLEHVKPPTGVGNSPDQRRAFQAMQQQLAYAEGRLAFCGGHEPMASMALYALGRSCLAAAQELPDNGPLFAPKAVTLYRAALGVDPRNCLAVNELALLLARCGQLDEGARVLLEGVRHNPQPQMWHNLAVIHEKMGRSDWAAEDRQRRDAMASAQVVPGRESSDTLLAAVQWMEPAEFVRCSGSEDMGQKSASGATGPATVPPAPATSTEAGEQAGETRSTPLLKKWMSSFLYPDMSAGDETRLQTTR